MGCALVLCGIKHCGKTSLGRELAGALGVPRLDTDELLEARSGVGVRELFRHAGETEFRRMERELIRTLPAEKFQVITLGGGALLDGENVPLVKKLGTLIWCDVSDETAFARVARGGLPPFLAGAADPESEFRRGNVSRRAVFERVCDVRFDADPELSPRENAERLRALLCAKGIIGQ